MLMAPESDLDRPHGGARQQRQQPLDARGLSVRRAGELTGVAAADFSRLRRAKLGRFTVDRLMTILDRLGQEVAVSVAFKARAQEAAPTVAPAHP